MAAAADPAAAGVEGPAPVALGSSPLPGVREAAAAPVVPESSVADPALASSASPGSSIWRGVRSGFVRWVDWSVPVALRGARTDPGWPGVAAVAAVVVLAAALAGFVVWRARPHEIPVTATPRAGAAAAAQPSPGPSVVVAVAGGVRRPGLITLPPGSRVADAVRAAGGVRPGVDIGLLNLARRLVDGEQVVVGASSQPAPAGSTAAGGPLNLNTATAEQFDALPGVGPVLAARIVTYRTQHGAFRSVDQLREVSGIGEAKFADLRPLVSV
ncbi:MAG: hypothetical protein DLM59_00865 [Pseudonocardiales bacterium]|nr:MAG: hypothetical protein DLM59_00865 [Pseudonocardiales bacterium]